MAVLSIPLDVASDSYATQLQQNKVQDLNAWGAVLSSSIILALELADVEDTSAHSLQQSLGHRTRSTQSKILYR